MVMKRQEYFLERDSDQPRLKAPYPCGSESADALAHEIRSHLLPGEKELIRISSDLSRDGSFGNTSVVVTDRRVLVFSPVGNGGASQISLQDIEGVRIEALVGGGFLELTLKQAPPLRMLYSASLSRQFSELAGAIDQLRQAGYFLALKKADDVRCSTCGRLLPEKNGICPACIPRWTTFRRIAAYLKPYKGQTLLVALASPLMTVPTLTPPMITRRIVDDVLMPQEVGGPSLDNRLRLLGLLVLGLFGLRLLSWGAEWAHGRTVAHLGARVTADIRRQLYEQLEKLSLRFYDKRAVGSLISRITNDAGTLQDFLIRGLPYLVSNVLILLGIFGFMFSMNRLLALCVLLPVPAIWAFGLLFWPRMNLLFQRWWQAGSTFTAQFAESLSGIRVIKAFAQEEHEIARFDKHNTDLRQSNVNTHRHRAVLFAVMGLMTSLGALTLWLLGGAKVIQRDLTLGTLLAFYSYLWLFYGPVQWLGQISNSMTKAFTGAQRIFEILDTRSEAHQDPDSAPMPRLEGGVRFREVTFGYDTSEPVLQEINLDFAAGERIGLVGKSGAGKTTMMNLLCRFYEVDHGSIEIDGVDIRRMRLEDLRSQIGVVLQDPFLFSGTILENISYGRPGACFEEVVEAAKVANAHHFIVAKPDGYDTEVGERGSRLSGGEKQRIALARAILCDPRILILDEATSAVDAESERLIQEAIGRLTRDRTIFIIAHRLSTLRSADRLIVLDGGRVVEVGTHEGLVARQGAFYNLVRLQQEGLEVVAGEA